MTGYKFRSGTADPGVWASFNHELWYDTVAPAIPAASNVGWWVQVEPTVTQFTIYFEVAMGTSLYLGYLIGWNGAWELHSGGNVAVVTPTEDRFLMQIGSDGFFCNGTECQITMGAAPSYDSTDTYITSEGNKIGSIYFEALTDLDTGTKYWDPATDGTADWKSWSVGEVADIFEIVEYDLGGSSTANKFRRVNSVPDKNANLAFISVPGSPASKIVDIIDPSGVAGIEHRRIMYADISGLLVSPTGDPAVAASYPTVTDMFYDRDQDRKLDSNEVIPEAALPYKYRSRRTYVGKGVYPASNPPTENVLVKDLSSSGVNDWAHTITLSNTEWAKLIAVVSAANLVGHHIIPTVQTWRLPSHVDTSGTTIYDETPPEPCIGNFRKITAVNEGSKTITYEESYFDDDGNRPNATVPISGSLGIISTLTFNVAMSITNSAPLYSLTGSEGIQLVDESGSEYSGRYMILVQRVNTSEDEVNDGSSYDGWAAHWVHVYLDRTDQDLYLKFRAGTTSQVGDIWGIGNIDEDHTERVDPVDLFNYTSMSNVLDPANESKDLVASIPLNEQHGIYVTERAFVDNRIIDRLMWRVGVEIERDTPFQTSKNQEELKVGVIGDVPDALKKFLEGDPSYSFRMNCRNPHPVNGSWVIDTSKAIMSDYDLVIYRSHDIAWSQIHTIAASVIDSGGVFLIDTASRNISIDGRHIAGGGTLEGSVPQKIKISIPSSNIVAFSTDATSPEVGAWLNTVVGGYTISDADALSLFPTADSSYVTDPNISEYPKRTPFIKATVGGASRWFVTELSKGLVFSTIGFTDMSNEACKQLFCNFVWGYGAADPTREIRVATRTSTEYSSWETSWVAGKNVNGDPILSPEEMKLYSFRIVNDDSDKRVVRELSNKSASQIIREHLTSSGKINLINGATDIRYFLEVASCDNAYVKCIGSLSGSQRPEAWSEREDSPLFEVQDGYLIRSYMEELVPGVMPSDPQDLVANVRVTGVLTKTEENNFTWSFNNGFSYETYTSTSKDEPLTKDSGYVSFVTTQSDIEWTAPHILEDHNVRSSKNIHDYGMKSGTGITGTKWYPWDGQSFLLGHAGQHGDYVTYVQNALNALAAVDRGHRTGKLTVDGNYGPKTIAAVRDYQKRWNFNARSQDGDVDAGTAGHIMRNAGTITGWKNLDDRWKTYGDMMNIVDGKDNTYSGRRTWINTTVDRMIDNIYIYLTEGIQITGVQIEPHLLGSGNAASNYLHIHRIGGRRKSDHRNFDWEFDHSKNLGQAKKVHDGTVWNRSVSLSNKLDMVCVGLYQDNAYSGRAKQWGVKNVLPVGKISSSVLVKKSADHLYNAPIVIASRSHDVNSKTTTVVTSSPHRFYVGTAFYLGTSTTRFVVTKVVSSTKFECLDLLNELTSGSVTQDLAVKIKTGERKMFIIKPSLPAGSKFLGWNSSIASITSSINASILPSTERSDVQASVELNSTTGELYVTFFSPLESVDTEVSRGKTFSIRMRSKDIYGIDNEYETGYCGSVSTTTVDSVTCTTIQSTTQFWKTNSLVGRTIRITSGVNNGNTATIQSNTEKGLVLDRFMTCVFGERYQITGNNCSTNAVSYTPTSSGSATTINVSTGAWNTDAHVGNLVLFTGNTVNDTRVAKILSNTATQLTIEAVTPALSSTTTADTFQIVTGHWPSFDNVEEDEVYTLTYRVEPWSANERINGVFLIVDEAGQVIEAFDQITYTDLIKYGFDRVKIGITNLYTIGDPSTGGVSKFPVRYAMKPFCLIEKTNGCILDINGLTGDQPSEVWGLQVETGSIKRSVKVPAGLTLSSTNMLTDFSAFINNGSGKIVDCTYNVGNNAFSTTYGEPFVDTIAEVATVVEWDADARTGSVQVLSTPIHEDADSNPIVHLHIDGSPTDIEVTQVDRDAGIISFVTTDLTYSPEVNVITADYTYREQYIGYRGGGVDTLTMDIFDLCPYNGHIMVVDGQTYNTVDLIGRPIYVYLLPTFSVCDSETKVKARSIYHTMDKTLFDSTSPFFNPFAILLCQATIKGINDIADTLILDTRNGGGGLLPQNIDRFKNTIQHYSGFQEANGFFDIGSMDGDAYLLGGSIIIELPLAWKEYWDSIGRGTDEMLEEFKNRWIPAGKAVLFKWVEIDPTFREDFNGNTLSSEWIQSYPPGVDYGQQQLMEESVVVNNGMATITTDIVKEFDYLTGQVRSIDEFGYGYFEFTGVRFAPGQGISGTIMLHDAVVGTTPRAVIVELQGGTPGTLNFFADLEDYTRVGQTYAGSDRTVGSHSIGIDKQPGYVKIYVNSVLRWSYTGTIASTPQWIVIGSNVGGELSWGGPPDEFTTFPQTAVVGGVSVFTNKDDVTPVFSHDFTTGLDTAVWNTNSPDINDDYPDGRPFRRPQTGFYDEGQVDVVGGELVLTTKLNDSSTLGWTWESGVIRSTQSFGPGRFDIRAKFPTGAGIWPAIWLSNGDASEGGTHEIDIMEWNSAPFANGLTPKQSLEDGKTTYVNAYHLWSPTHTTPYGEWVGHVGDDPDPTWPRGPIDYSADFHTYSIDWREGSITWYVDGVIVGEYVGTTYPEPLQLVINTVVGSLTSWGGPPDVDTMAAAPFKFEIEYIKYW